MREGIMSYLPRNDDGGFTIVEIVVGLAVGLILLGIAVRMFIVQQEVFDLQEQLSEMHQNIRVAMDTITRDARMAGYDPTSADFDGIPYDVTQLEIYADLDGDGTTTGTHEAIIYSYGTDTIDRDTGGGLQTLVENIQAFTFNYLGANGSNTTTSSSIRQIQIQITGRTSKIVPNIGTYRYGTLTTFVTPINLGY